MTISKQMLNIIEKAVDSAAIKFSKINNLQDINPYKKTEKVLYAYPKLKNIIKSTYIDIEDLIIEGIPGHSKDIVKMPKFNEGEKKDIDDILLEKVQIKKDNLKRTEFDVKCIEKALEKLKEEDMNLIRMKYFDNMTLVDIAEEIYCSEATVRRSRKRIINDLSNYLFTSEVLNIR